MRRRVSAFGWAPVRRATSLGTRSWASPNPTLNHPSDCANFRDPAEVVAELLADDVDGELIARPSPTPPSSYVLVSIEIAIG